MRGNLHQKGCLIERISILDGLLGKTINKKVREDTNLCRGIKITQVADDVLTKTTNLLLEKPCTFRSYSLLLTITFRPR
jgi:hypothetical protein